MISIIVPVYNVEPYLRKCLDSILDQTYRDLEILVVDDGSTDGSGKICDDYKKDERVRVFHTENRGLSAARNLGLDNATGDWIGFVDSDDWIEPDMYEVMLRKAEETGADIVECGYIIEYVKKQKKCSAIQKIVPSVETIEALINGKIQTRVWNKIYCGKLFTETRFPDGRCFEDIATTHKLVYNSIVTGCLGFYYHYTQRYSSISQNHDSQNLIDYWLAHKQRYEETKDIVNDETKQVLLKQCASAISRTWVWYLKSDRFPKYINEMNTFARENYPVFGVNGWPIYLRICVFLARYNNTLSYITAYYLNQLYRHYKQKTFIE